MDYSELLEKLTPVKDALSLPYEKYKSIADGILEQREHCLSGFAEFYPKFYDWCVHLNCTVKEEYCHGAPIESFPTDSTLTTEARLLPTTRYYYASNSSVWNYIQSNCYNDSNCFDDYFCDHAELATANNYVLGYGCLIICLFGIVSNLVLLPTYNLGLNVSGATVHLSAMAIFDMFYLLLTLLIVVSRYIHGEYHEQVISYAQFGSRFIPIGSALMQFCEVLVVWLVVALLTNRLLYMKLGFQSKLLCSRVQSIKAIVALIVFILTYSSCKLLEYTHVQHAPVGIQQVVRTTIGNSPLYQNLMYHWLKVPIEMFLPYLSVSVLVSVVVKKMLGFHKSKWKAVASLCNDTACACVCRTGVCGTVCKESGLERPNEVTLVTKSSSQVITEQGSSLQLPEHKAHLPSKSDPIEQELTYLFLQTPQVDETREHANVIAAVCIGFLLVLLKFPKFILHVLSTENYITHDPVIFNLIEQFLDTIFAACKPSVCILVGAHFRHVLLAPRQCCVPQRATMRTRKVDVGLELNDLPVS